MLRHPISLPPAALTLLVFAALPARAQVTYIKEDNTTNLNNAAAWVVDDGAGNFFTPGTAPTNVTNSPDTWFWGNRIVSGPNTVNLGNNIGTLRVKVENPAGNVTIGGNNTMTIATGGSIDLSSATVDLTLNNGFTRIGVAAGNYTVKTAAGRTVTFNGTLNARLANAANKAIFEGPGRAVVNGDYQPASCDVTGGTVLFARSSGNSVAAGGTFSIYGGTLLAGNVSGSATGTTPVNASGGAVGGTGIMNSMVTIGSGATLAPGIAGAGRLTVAGLTLDNGALLAFDFTNTVAYDNVDVTGLNSLTINGGRISALATGAASPYAGNGTYNLIRYNGTIGGTGVGALSIDPATQIAGKTYSLGEEGGFVTLTISAAGGASRFWNVDTGGLWTTGANWTGGTVPNSPSAFAGFGAGGAPITAPRTVLLNAAQTVGTLSFNSAQPFTIEGTGPLTMDDTGAAASITAAAGSHTVNVPITLTNGGAVVTVTAANDTLAINGAITGGSALAKSGAGTLILSADNAYSGGTTIGAGTLQFGTGGTTGSVTGPIANDGTLRFDRSDAALDISAPVTGTGSLVKAGPGTVTLSGANTFTGTTTVPQGTLMVNHSLALQGSTLQLDAGGGTVTFGSTVTTDVTLGGLAGTASIVMQNDASQPLNLVFGVNGRDSLYGGALTGHRVTKTGAGAFILTGSAALSGPLLVSGGSVVCRTGAIIASAVSTPTAGGGLVNVESGTLTAAGLSTIGGGTRGLLVSGGVAEFLSGLQTDMGQNADWFIHVNGGELRASSLSLGRSTLNYSTEPGGGSNDKGLRITSGSAIITGPLNLGVNNSANSSVSAKIDGGSLRVDGPVTIGLNNAGRWSILDVNGGTFASTDPLVGVVLGAPALQTESQAVFIVRNGVATVERVQIGNPGESDIGVVHVTGGELQVGSGGIVGADDAAALLGTLRLAGGVIGANAAWGSDVPVQFPSMVEIRCASGSGTAADITLRGPVSGGGGFTKTGAGSLTLAGVGSWTGASLASAGTLLIEGDSSTASAPLSIQTGAALGGSGTSGGDVTIESGATLAPGAPGAVGSLTVGSLVLDGRMAAQVDGAADSAARQTDLCSVNGPVVLGAGSSLQITATGAPLTGASHDLISGTSVTGTFGTVSGIPAGYAISYSATRVSLVSAGATPYSAWADAAGLAGADAAMTADPDADGLVNLVEFALNGNPRLADSAGVLHASTGAVGADNALLLTIAVPTGAVFSGATSQSASAQGITITVEGSADLNAWNTTVVSEVTPARAAGLPAPAAGWSYRTFRTPGGTAGDLRDYLRVRVVAN